MKKESLPDSRQNVSPVFVPWNKILGHSEQIGRLRKLVAENRLPHAVLFSGPDGIGKHMVARTLAASLLCEGGAPCGTCPQCKAFLGNVHPDFWEVIPEGNAKKTIKIDAIRKMESILNRVPAQADKRIAIIDAADTMNESAANSLLKTLEEPPENTFIILVSSKPSSLLDTIRSRCMNMSFGNIDENILADALVKRGLPTETAKELAALSGGSFGCSLNLYEDGGLAVRDSAASFLDSLSAFSVFDMFEKVEEMSRMERRELSSWFSYIESILRDLLVMEVGGSDKLLFHKDLSDKLRKLAIPEPRIRALLVLVGDTELRLQANINQRLLLEGFFLRAMKNG